MAKRSTDRLKPRKLPSQSRSQATVGAIFEATVQVLLEGGATAVNTGRVAEKAGVSIGTLYQYFPGKEALIYELAKRHLERATVTVEAACREHAGQSVRTCSDAFVNAYLDAKMQNPKTSRALYQASMTFDVRNLTDEMLKRLRAAAHGLLAGAKQVRFANLDGLVFNWVAMVTGSTRHLLEDDGAEQRLPLFREHLVQMSRAYLESIDTRG